jgi:hypothetical protein
MTLKIPALSLLVALVAAAPAKAAEPQVLSAFGIGPVRIGMTLAEANKALGYTLETSSDQDPTGECLIAGRHLSTDDSDGAGDGVSYLVIKQRIRVVTAQGAKDSQAVTPSGVRPGDSLARLQAVYGPRLKRMSPIDADSDRRVVDTADHRGGVVFTIEDGVVRYIQGGGYPELRYEEECL